MGLGSSVILAPAVLAETIALGRGPGGVAARDSGLLTRGTGPSASRPTVRRRSGRSRAALEGGGRLAATHPLFGSPGEDWCERETSWEHPSLNPRGRGMWFVRDV